MGGAPAGEDEDGTVGVVLAILPVVETVQFVVTVDGDGDEVITVGAIEFFGNNDGSNNRLYK